MQPITMLYRQGFCVGAGGLVLLRRIPQATSMILKYDRRATAAAHSARHDDDANYLGRWPQKRLPTQKSILS